MDLEKATQVLTSIKEALSTVLLDNQMKETKLKKLQPIAEENKTLRRENTILKERVYTLERIAQLSPFKLCDNCNGRGGFEYETPEGTQGDQCGKCNGSGIVEKEASIISN